MGKGCVSHSICVPGHSTMSLTRPMLNKPPSIVAYILTNKGHDRATSSSFKAPRFADSEMG